MKKQTIPYRRQGTGGVNKRPVRTQRQSNRSSGGLIVAMLIVTGAIGAVGGYFLFFTPHSPTQIANAVEPATTENTHQLAPPSKVEPFAPPKTPVTSPSPVAQTAKVTKSPTTTTPKPASAAKNPPSETPSIPWRNNTTLRHVSVPAPGTIREGWFEIKTTMSAQPTVRCDYRIPLDAENRPLATAADIVLLFPYPGEPAAISAGGSILTDKCGFTTLSLRFSRMSSANVDDNDPTKWYYWPESGSGNAWIEAIKRVKSIGGFPDRSVFVAGRSGGGSAAGLFADAHPEMVAAVANAAGRVFVEVPQFNGPVLLMHGHHDNVVLPQIMAYDECARLAGVQLTRLSYPAKWSGRGTSPIWQHSLHGPAEQAFWQWVMTVADIRLDKGGIMPPPTSWPIQYHGISYPSTEVKSIMDQVTPISSQMSAAEGTVIIAKPAPSVTLHGLIILADNGITADSKELMFDAECLADHGWVVVAAGADKSVVLPSLRSALLSAELTSLEQLPWLLVLDEPNEINDYLRLRKTPPIGIALDKVSRKFVQHAILSLGQTSSQLLVIELKGHIDRLKVPTSGTTVIWKEIDPNNNGTWHRDQCNAIADQADLWLSTKRQIK